MTFNQWCARYRFSFHARISVEAIWNALAAGGLIEPATCKKYRQITMQEGHKIPDDAAACKYFDRNEVVPERFSK